MMIHGQELSKEWLDTMWVAITEKIPDNKWVEITKDHDRSVAAIKHFIDNHCYSESFDLMFNKDFTMFQKVSFVKPVIRYKRFMKKEELEKLEKSIT